MDKTKRITHATSDVVGKLAGSVALTPEAIRYCLYARKSTEEDEKQALSIESQIKEMLALAQRDGIDIADIRQESHSAKTSGERPVFKALIEDIRKGMFTGILAWMPDRLSRNAGDLGAVVDLMDSKHLVEVRTYGQKFTNTPSEKFMLMIMGSQAKLENDNKSLNVKRGLRALVEKGLWPVCAPAGYLNAKNRDQKCHVLVDHQRAPTIRKMFEKVAYEGWSGRRLHAWLKDELKFTSKYGTPFALSNLYIILRNSFYYGVFEYPKGGGNWYQGKHTPLISKELFDAVQERLDAELDDKTRHKEFPFTKLMKCGNCGSGITALEKFKKLKGGGTNRYVYYGCCRSRDQKCVNRYIREEDLLEQLLAVMDTLSLDKIGMREKIEQEIKSHREFQQTVLGEKFDAGPAKEIDIRNYAKYVLRAKSNLDKRELLNCLKSKIVIKDKKVVVE